MSARQQMHCALLLLVLCALGVQQGAAQGHWHAAEAEISSVPGSSSPVDDSGNGLPGHDCVLCQIASHAGAAAPPAVWAGLPTTDTSSAIRLAASVPAAFSSPPAWAWQSRGPPAV
jgi:hypothetical protein